MKLSKQLLLDILCAIILSSFIGFLYLFFTNVSNSITGNIIVASDWNSSKFLQDYVNSSNEDFQSLITDTTTRYNTDSNTSAILLLHGLATLKSIEIVHVFYICIIIGLILGTLTFLIFHQQSKGFDLLMKCIVAIVAICIISGLFLLGYSFIILKIAQDNTLSLEDVLGLPIDISNQSILILFTILLILFYLINLIYQKYITKKINSELLKK